MALSNKKTIQQTLKNYLQLLAIVTTAVCLPLAGRVSAAGTAKLYLSPASATVAQGSSLSINVYEDSGTDSVNAVQANLSYSSSLTFVSITSSSAFGIDAQSTGGSGSVKIGRGTISPVTGAQIVATVRFTYSGSTGPASVSFASGSSVVRSSDNQQETLTTTGGTYNVSVPSSPPPSSPPPSSPPPSSSPSSSSTTTKKTTSSSPAATPSATNTATTPTASTASKTAPVISDLNTGNTAGGVTIEWKTNTPASSEVDYGLTTDYGFSAADAKLVTDHKLVLDPKTLAAGKTLHYVVKSVDASGNQVVTKDQTITINAAKAAASSGATKSQIVLLSSGLAMLMVAGGLAWHSLRRHALARAELSRHMPDLPATANTPPPAGGTVVNPGNPSSSPTPNNNQDRFKKGP